MELSWPSARVRSSEEFSSALIRLGIWAAVGAFFAFGTLSGYRPLPMLEFLVFLLAYLVYASGVLVSVFKRPWLPARRYFTMVCDIAATSYAMVISGAGPISPYYLFYLWIYIGYGARYGRQQLFTAMGASLFCYGLVLLHDLTWQDFGFEVAIYVAFLAVLPLYLNMLLTQLNRARADADRANRAKGEFLANMSHEIRTPMGGILGMTSLLGGTALGHAQREYVQALRTSATALSALIDDVLDLSKIEAGKCHLEEREFDPAEVIESVACMFAGEAYAKGLAMLSHVDPQLPRRVLGDPDRLRQVLINLVSNAVKFTSAGEVVVRATPLLGARRIRVEVQDTGAGIAETHLPYVFERFYQAGNSSAPGGTGLGTTISRDLVRLMGGEIGVQSQPGTGSCFWVELPLKAAPVSDPAPPEPTLTGGVLIVDRIPGSARVLADYCAFLGLEPIVARDALTAEAALEGAGTRPLRVALLDEQSLGADTAAFAARLRRRCARVRIVRLTHLELLERDVDAVACFDGELIKPVQFAVLARMLRGSLREPPPADRASQPPAGPPLRMLVAEDSPINAKVISTFLEQAGHAVDVVEDGAAALAAMQARRYDLVFMDIRMPRMDGLAATRLWRAQEGSGRRLPIVALTANATVDDQERCVQAGMDAFLTKPVTLQKLLATVERHLGADLPGQDAGAGLKAN